MLQGFESSLSLQCCVVGVRIYVESTVLCCRFESTLSQQFYVVGSNLR